MEKRKNTTEVLPLFDQSIVNVADVATICGDSAPVGHETVDLGKYFGKSFKGLEMEIPVFSAGNQYFGKPIENYVFEEKSLREYLSFMDDSCGDALYLYGPSGCGKTSAINQIAAILKHPVISITLNGRFELADLIGHQSVINGEVVFVHGPLARAMKYGYVLILNEIDLADAGELAGLNDVLEGRSLVVIQNNGEVIPPHPDFRLIVTANTAGTGSTRGSYHGTQHLNAAFLDRFRFIPCDYMAAKDEIDLIKKSSPKLSEKTIKGMVRIANEIRISHTKPEANHVYMSVPMSTRSLLRWARLTSSYSFSESPLKTALSHAFTGRLSSEEADYVQRLADDVFGPEVDHA